LFPSDQHGAVAPGFRHIIPLALIEKHDLHTTKDETMRTAGIMLLLIVILQGCGRKGPLFLPPVPAANPQAAPAQPDVEKSESRKQP
jgi:predicted small lipoprotein YifL